jgi:type IV secretion system protein VirB10
MTRLCIRLLLTVTALASAAGPAMGQTVVYDPSNYSQNVLQAARALQQINNQVTILQNQTQMLLNQARNLASLPYSAAQPIDQSVARTQKTAPAGQTEAAPFDPGALLNTQDRKLAFVNSTVDRKTISPDRLENPASRYVVQAGSVIAAALITGLRSDLPGQVTAQVTENVYDSPSGRYLLIPQGSKLVGAYDSQVAFGQNRLLLAWTRLIPPGGRSVVLERQPGADPEGFTGLEDEVDQHWGRLAMAAALSTVMGIGTELGSNASDSAIASALSKGSSNSLSQTGQQVVQRNLNIQPTLTVRPGFPVRVIVNRDLVLAPYRN